MICQTILKTSLRFRVDEYAMTIQTRIEQTGIARRRIKVSN
jgi:hypothetical protein